MRMRLRQGYAPLRRRPKRIRKKLAKRYGWAKCRVPPWIVMMAESKMLGIAAAQALNRAVANMVAEPTKLTPEQLEYGQELAKRC